MDYYESWRSRPGPSLQLLDAVGVHPETAASAANIAATGQYRIRPLNANIGLVKVQGVTEFHTAIAQAFNMKLVEQGESIVHVFEGEIVGANLDSSPDDIVCTIRVPHSQSGECCCLVDRRSSPLLLPPARHPTIS